MRHASYITHLPRNSSGQPTLSAAKTKPKLLDQLHEALGSRHYSRTFRHSFATHVLEGGYDIRRHLIRIGKQESASYADPSNLDGKTGDKMSMRLEIRFESGRLNVDAVGKFSLKEAKRTFIEMLEAVALHKTNKVFFDGRKIIGKPEIMERFYYGEFAARTVWYFAELGVSPATRYAYVLRAPVLDPGRFGETVARNRGMDVMTFDNPEEALQWLGIAPANKLDAGDGK